ncbi:3,4-dihydroxy-2-butanone-4-phosphate synthase [Salinicola endophyticus]|uniref:3,4-dihydroxy-2-butanone-4-phosphate synthase n=1 Tax=Salinicola endophyticus TaxID=1949083 RepID=UPI000DA25391|nr:3,4-dihydroxy-2-butanone-4-phosphate synthase [Salinicola endophyticus]
MTTKPLTCRDDTPFDTIEEIIADMRAGKMVLMVDDEDRENEGDLVLAADHVSAEAINFMARHARGLICLTLSGERCDRLGLPLMVRDNGSSFTTAFTVSIEAREGVTTGISAADRAATVRAAVAPDASPRDLVSPGHIFPLRAQPGGVLQRAGHTEAGCDLARLAGLEPAAVIVEVMEEDGSMAKRDSLLAFARQHGIRIGTIADLIHYRSSTEQTIASVGHQALDTVHGRFELYSFADSVDDEVHLALMMGAPDAERAFPVYVHVTDPLRDLVGARAPGAPLGWTLWQALETIAAQGEGVVVILAHQDSPASLLSRAVHIQQGDLTRLRRDKARTGTGSQILARLGVTRIRLLGAPGPYRGLAGFGLEVVDTLAPQGAEDGSQEMK